MTNREAIRSAFFTDTGGDVDMIDIDPVTGSSSVVEGYAELYLDVKVAEHKTINFGSSCVSRSYQNLNEGR